MFWVRNPSDVKYADTKYKFDELLNKQGKIYNRLRAHYYIYCYPKLGVGRCTV